MNHSRPPLAAPAAPRRPRRTALLAAYAAAAALVACSLVAVPAQAARAAAPRNTIRLSPSLVQLPRTPHGASPAVETYLHAARQAVREVYLRGADDTAAIAALAHELDANDALAQLRDPWDDILITTHARALAQARLAPTLSALAEAAHDARPIRAGRLGHLEPTACARAFAQPMAQAAGASNMVVVVRPAGPQPLSAWREACQASANPARTRKALARTLPKRPRRR